VTSHLVSTDFINPMVKGLSIITPGSVTPLSVIGIEKWIIERITIVWLL